MEKERNQATKKDVETRKGSVDRTKYPPTDYLPVEEKIITDPLGSWTGTPVPDRHEKPVQDVDDL